MHIFKWAVWLVIGLSVCCFMACDGGGNTTVNTSGQVMLGPVVGATVSIYAVADLNDSGPPAPIIRTTTQDNDSIEEAGWFGLMSQTRLKPGELYILVAQGGEDIDADDDGVVDTEPTPVYGKLHAVATGSQLLSGNCVINILTETAYQRVSYLLADAQASSTDIINKLDGIAAQMVGDINGDGRVDNSDLLRWQPLNPRHMAALRTPYKQFTPQIKAIHTGANINPGDVNMSLVIGSYDTEGSVQDVAVSGSYAYVADGPGGLVVLNASDPADLTKAGELALDGIALNILIDETSHLAYIAGGEAGLHVVDISDPAVPDLLGTANDMPGYAQRLRLRFPYVFIVDPLQGLLVADVSDPAAPFIAGSYLSDSVQDVAVSGDWAFLSGSILDISDPENPVDTGDTIDGDSLYGSAVYGDYLVTVIRSGMDGVGLFDISDPASGVSPVSRYKSMDTRDVRVYGNYAYVICQSFPIPGTLESSVHIIDLSDPENLKLAGHFQDDQRTITQVTAHDGYLFLSRGNRGVEVISQALTAPTGMLGNYITRNQLWRFEVKDKIAYLPQQTGSMPSFPVYPEFEIVDVSNPAQPERIFRDGATGCMLQEDIYVGGGYAYLLSDGAYSYDDPDYPSWGNLITYDVSDPSNPVITDTLPVPDGWSGIDREGDYLYTSSHIIDIKDPAHPVRVDSITSTSSSGEVQMVDSLLYYIDYRVLGSTLEWNFHIIDPYTFLRSGGATLEVGYYTFKDDVVYGFTISDGYAYVANNQAGVRILDLYDPELPKLAGTYDTAGEVFAVGVHGRYAYVGDWIDGVTVVDISNPYNPAYVTHFDCPMVSWVDIEEDDPGYVYVGGSTGLYIYPLLENVLP